MLPLPQPPVGSCPCLINPRRTLLYAVGPCLPHTIAPVASVPRQACHTRLTHSGPSVALPAKPRAHATSPHLALPAQPQRVLRHHARPGVTSPALPYPAAPSIPIVTWPAERQLALALHSLPGLPEPAYPCQSPPCHTCHCTSDLARPDLTQHRLACRIAPHFALPVESTPCFTCSTASNLALPDYPCQTWPASPSGCSSCDFEPCLTCRTQSFHARPSTAMPALHSTPSPS
jgi:hypothetical protein